MNPVSANQVGELRRLNAISLDEFVLDGETVSQAHGLRAMRSSGGDENFQVQRLRNCR